MIGVTLPLIQYGNVEWESMRTTLFSLCLSSTTQATTEGRKKKLWKFLLLNKPVSSGKREAISGKIHLKECKIIAKD